MISRKLAFSTVAAGAAALTMGVLPGVSGLVSANAVTQPGTRAIATFDAATDTTPQLINGETSPRGQFVYDQVEDAANLNDVTVNGTVTGLRPLSSYVTVLYTDAVCLPTPSVTAFPSAPFTTDVTGKAILRNLPLNPQAINALRTFDVEETRSVSIRDVLLPGQTIGGLPVTVPTVPNGAETETCDKAPNVN